MERFGVNRGLEGGDGAPIKRMIYKAEFIGIETRYTF